MYNKFEVPNEYIKPFYLNERDKENGIYSMRIESWKLEMIKALPDILGFPLKIDGDKRRNDIYSFYDKTGTARKIYDDLKAGIISDEESQKRLSAILSKNHP